MARAWLAGAYVIGIYPVFLAGSEGIESSLVPVLWVATALGLVLAGMAPLGRYRYLLPASWIAMSLAYDADGSGGPRPRR